MVKEAAGERGGTTSLKTNVPLVEQVCLHLLIQDSLRGSGGGGGGRVVAGDAASHPKLSHWDLLASYKYKLATVYRDR